MRRGAQGVGLAALVVVALIAAPAQAMQRVPAGGATRLTVVGLPRFLDDSSVSLPSPLGSGDVDGDGTADAIIGSPRESPAGRREAGAAYVIRGGTAARRVDIRRLGDAGYRVEGAPPALPVELDDDGPAGERAGQSVAGVGDVNGDGIDDLAIGAPASSAGGRPLAGAVYVAFGRRPGGTTDLGALDGGYRIDGATPSGRAGTHVAAAGDANGDGLADVVLSDRRGSWIAYGQRGTQPIDLAAPGTRALPIRREPGKDIEGDTPRDFPVAGTGDTNGDGLADVVIGAPGLTPRGRYRAGAAYVVLGRRAPGEVHLDRLGAGGFRIDGEDDSGFVGSAVAPAGDVNGDGLADVLVGAPDLGGDSSDESDDHGAAYVVFGRRRPARVDLGHRGDTATRLLGDADETDGSVGASLAALGDVNGDGLDDVAVGAPGWDADCRHDSGAIFVVRGRRRAVSVDLGRTTPGVYRLDGAAPGSGLGAALAPLRRRGRPGALLLAGAAPPTLRGRPAAPVVLDPALSRGARPGLAPSACVGARLLSQRTSRILHTRRLTVRLHVAVPVRGAQYQVEVLAVVGRDREVVLGAHAGRVRGTSTTLRLRLTRSGRRVLRRHRRLRAGVITYLQAGDDVRTVVNLTRLRP